jgi:gliding motility-associated-like protein
MPPNGTAHPDANTVIASNIGAVDFFEPWTLVNESIDWEMFIPNAFTPDNNGVNDGWGPIGLNFELFAQYDLYVYNRWGQEVFHSTDPEVLWNGSFNNDKKTCQDGVYVWLLMLTDKYGEQFKKKGTVTLLGRGK